MKRIVWEVFSVGGFRKEVEGEDGRRFNCLCAPLFPQPRQKQFIYGKLCFLQMASWGLPCVVSATRICTPPRRILGLESIWGNPGLFSDKQNVVPSTDRHTTQCSSVVPVLMWASHSIFLISTPTLTPPAPPPPPHPRQVGSRYAPEPRRKGEGRSVVQAGSVSPGCVSLTHGTKLA